MKNCISFSWLKHQINDRLKYILICDYICILLFFDSEVIRDKILEVFLETVAALSGLESDH